MAMLRRCAMFPATIFIRSWKGKESRIRSRCLLPLRLPAAVRRITLIKRAPRLFDAGSDSHRNSRDDAMPSVRERSNLLNGLLKGVPSSLMVAAAIAASFLPASRAVAVDDPAKALQAEFESAKASLAA